MDDLVLAGVGVALGRSLAGAVLEDLREEPRQRLRLVFISGASRRSLLISFDPSCPWIGRPARSAPAASPPGPFVVACAKSLRGRIIESVRRESVRRAVLSFAGGDRLVVELIPARSNVILVAADGSVTAVGRWSKDVAERLTPGAPYRAPSWPADRVDAVGATTEALLEALEGADDAERIQRRLAGISRESAQLALDEASRDGRRLAEVLAARSASLARGEIEPVIESKAAPVEAAERGELDLASTRLLPWAPLRSPPPGLERRSGEDAAATAGSYYEAVHLHSRLHARCAGLLGVLQSELRKTRRARARVEEDLAGFADPDRHRIQGEALLAGLSSARRVGDHVLVPDPYDEEGGRTISIPAPPARSLQEVARQAFKLHRRAKRGLETCNARAAQLDARRERLTGLAERFATEPASLGGIEALERAMREAGIAVGLERAPSKRAPSPARFEKPRLEGVRLLHASDGTEILVGRGGRENDRLTFKLAGPEDFWFHARDVPGAHVILRNPLRTARPAEGACLEAAAVAAWFSDARTEARADVLWTRRKYVRRSKGAPAGTVTIKKSETLRVRPALPAGSVPGY